VQCFIKRDRTTSTYQLFLGLPPSMSHIPFCAFDLLFLEFFCAELLQPIGSIVDFCTSFVHCVLVIASGMHKWCLQAFLATAGESHPPNSDGDPLIE
jgi:hypothetical protein